MSQIIEMKQTSAKANKMAQLVEYIQQRAAKEAAESKDNDNEAERGSSIVPVVFPTGNSSESIVEETGGTNQEKDGALLRDALEPLPQEEIEIARARIKELHPLQDAPIEQVLPYVAYCVRCCLKRERYKQGKRKKRGDDQDIREVDERLEQIVKNVGGAPYEGMNIVEDERKAEHEAEQKMSSSVDLFDGYGFGIVAYFSLLRSLILSYIFICGVACWIMHLYSSRDALSGERNSSVTQFMLGNMGYVESECFNQFLGIDKSLKLNCEVGTMSKLGYIGLKPNK